jgi:phenylpropionate dioxygenase-like ring-hydroxylating dioxygenase large terminal subunit
MAANFDYKRGFVVYPNAQGEDAAAKAPYVDHGTARPDKRRYYSAEEAKLEWEGLWMKTWSFAGLTQDLTKVGDYFRYNLGKESFVVVRAEPGDAGVRAYYNVCPHRGNRLVHTDFGHMSGGCFTCDFHGWKYGLDGGNREIRDEQIFRKEVISDRPGLTAVSCSVWNGLVFVNPDPKAAPLHDQLGVMVQHLAPYPFERFRVFRDLEVCWAANWKTAMDAFLEFYHADDVHPEVVPLTATLECQYDLYENGNSRMIIPVGFTTGRIQDRDSVSDGLKAMLRAYGGDPDHYLSLKGHRYQDALVQVKRQWGRKQGYDFFENLSDAQITDDWNYSPFPNMTINVFADSLLLQIFRPHPTDASKSYYSAITLCLPVSDEDTQVFDLNEFAHGPKGWKGDERPARFEPKDVSEFGYVLAQDARRVPEVQKGIESESFHGSRLSESESRIRHYLAEIDRRLGRLPA